jgi:hypothetical protein
MRRLLIFATTLFVVGLGFATPARAAPVDQWGFALVDRPTAPLWTKLNPGFQATSPASPNVEGGKISPGVFVVKFIGLGLGLGQAGIVHVTAIDKRGYYCGAVKWMGTSGDMVVEVQCFAPGGVPADSRFAVMWSLNTTFWPATAGAYASLQFEVSSGLVQAYNSTGAGIKLTPLGTGVMAVRFQKVGIGGSQITGNVQATAVSHLNDPRWCKIGGWDDDRSDMIALVYCFDATGTLADTDFTATYHRDVSVVSSSVYPKYSAYIWTPDPVPPNAKQTNANRLTGLYGFNKVSHAGVADIQVGFPISAVNETHVQVTAFGSDPTYCTLRWPWVIVGNDLTADVRCYDPAGRPAPNEAFVTMTNRS